MQRRAPNIAGGRQTSPRRCPQLTSNDACVAASLHQKETLRHLGKLASYTGDSAEATKRHSQISHDIDTGLQAVPRRVGEPMT